MATASTLTDVANLALSILGDKRIRNIDDDGGLSDLVRPMLYESIRQTQLEISWQELRVSYTPTGTGNTHSQETAYYEYNLPNNFLDMVDVNGGADWFLEDSKLYAKASEAKVTYKKYSEEVTEWSGYLVEMVYKRTAMNCAMAVTQNAGIAQQASQLYELAKVNNLMKSQNRARNVAYRQQDYIWSRTRRARY